MPQCTVVTTQFSLCSTTSMVVMVQVMVVLPLTFKMRRTMIMCLSGNFYIDRSVVRCLLLHDNFVDGLFFIYLFQNMKLKYSILNVEEMFNVSNLWFKN